MHIELRPLIAIVCLALLSHVVGPSRTLGQSARPASASRSVASPTALSDRTVVARVNDQPIYKADVDRAMVTLTGGRTVEPAQLENFQAATLAQLIAQQLVFDFIKEKGLAAAESYRATGASTSASTTAFVTTSRPITSFLPPMVTMLLGDTRKRSSGKNWK